MRTYQYKSDMGELLKCYLKEKKMTGFKFEKQARELERFDDYYYRAGYRGVKLTRPMAEAFIYGISYEKPSTHYKKEILLKQRKDVVSEEENLAQHRSFYFLVILCVQSFVKDFAFVRYAQTPVPCFRRYWYVGFFRPVFSLDNDFECFW